MYDEDQVQYYSFNTGKIRPFHDADYVVFVLTLLASAGIGVFAAFVDMFRDKNNTAEFLLGGKNMGVFPVAMSLTVTFMSALTLLGNPAEMYNFNTMWWWLSLSHTIAILAAAYIFVPFFFRLQVTSVFEYLEMRFNKPVRILSSCLLILQTLIYMAFLLYAPSLAMQAVTGVSLWGSAIGMAIIVTFYTTIGGMKAVLWTDTFQCGIIVAGLLAVLIRGSIVQGGFPAAWDIANNHRGISRVVFLQFSIDPRERHTVWGMIFGAGCFWIYLYGINQSQVQRCLSCPTVEKARAALFVNLPGLYLIVGLCCMVGIVMFAFYKDCDPIKYGIISKSDQLVPLFVSDILGHIPGLPGLFLSCVVSGSLSSLSSGLNALSAVTFSDIIKAFNFEALKSEVKSTWIAKGLVFGYGGIALALAWVVSKMGNVLQAVYIVFGLLNGPVLGVMTLGMFFPWANKHGAMIGLLAALAISGWVGLGCYVHGLKDPTTPVFYNGCNWTARTTPTPPAMTPAPKRPLLEPLYRLSYIWLTGFGMLVVWLFGLIITVFTGPRKPEDMDPRLIIPIVEEVCPFLPKYILEYYRFGIKHEGKWDKTPPLFYYSIDIPAPPRTQSQTDQITGQPRPAIVPCASNSLGPFGSAVDPGGDEEPMVTYETLQKLEFDPTPEINHSTDVLPRLIGEEVEISIPAPPTSA